MTPDVETGSGSERGLPPPKERRRLRESGELTHEQVATELGVTPGTVRSWERGRTEPGARTRAAYAALLDRLARAGADHPKPPSPHPAPTPPDPTPADATPAAAPPAHPPADGTAPGVSAPVGGAPHPGPTLPADADAGAAAAAVPPAAGAGAVAGRPVRPAEAFDALYAYSAPALVRQVYLLTGRRTLAQESVERAFRQAWAQWPEVATDPDPVGWVRSAAYEYALSPWRRLRRAHRIPSQPDKAPADPNDRILLGALLALPPAHRRTVLLYDGVGLDLPDTAAETEASTPTTGNRLLHAHADLAARLPGLADVPPQERSAVLRAWLGAVRPAVPLEPPAAATVRTLSEHRARRWARAALMLTAVIAVTTGYTTVTAPDHYVAPVPAGVSVSGVPPLSGPPRLTETSRFLQDKLRDHPAAGPRRIHPKPE
ncbi:helix-turn-helix domain-containing protein [Streptomyces sp. NPDC006670]|uniref:helix-turn-helix domain-containing protein n=1 Tax=Streptomyces sp. NPDC006670 TaxID=3154476 RepID=UPI0033CC83F9